MERKSKIIIGILSMSIILAIIGLIIISLNSNYSIDNSDGDGSQCSITKDQYPEWKTQIVPIKYINSDLYYRGHIEYNIPFDVSYKEPKLISAEMLIDKNIYILHFDCLNMEIEMNRLDKTYTMRGIFIKGYPDKENVWFCETSPFVYKDSSTIPSGLSECYPQQGMIGTIRVSFYIDLLKFTSR